MNDFNDDIAETISTALAEADAGGSGGGAPTLTPDDMQGDIADALKEVEEAPTDEQADKADDKTKDAKEPEEGAKEDAPKPEKKRAPDGKFASDKPVEDDASEEDGEKDDGEADEEEPPVRQYKTTEPPARFNPDAKAKWDNTPRSVRRDVELMVREHEAEIATAREAVEKYDKIRVFDEHARANGWDGAHESLAEMHRLERNLSSNPLATLDDILQRAGPTKQDGSRYSLYEVAQYVVQQLGQQGMQQTVQQARQQEQALQAQQAQQQQFATLEQENAALRAQQLMAQVVEPFKASHPRYGELSQDIAFFLQSGKVPENLSLEDRLELAYDMAERLNPVSTSANAALPSSQDDVRTITPDLSGKKSIKTSPGVVVDDDDSDENDDITELLRKEMRKASIR